MGIRRFLVVGAGFSGAVLARVLAENVDALIHVIDERDHIAGNCHTARDPETGVMVHEYGPHIFNTDREDVWKYIQKFGIFYPYINRVKASVSRGIFSFPVNLHTINQFFGKKFNPAEAKIFVETLGVKEIEHPRNFEEQALKFLGEELYHAFFYGYTKKQWGCEPSELPASLLKRLPIRFSYDDNYYTTIFQGIPIDGYTMIVQRMLAHPKIRLQLNCMFNTNSESEYEHIFYTGAIDRYFECGAKSLSYRTIHFATHRSKGDFQGNAVINYPELNVPYTRIHEHKHFAKWEKHEQSTILIEHSRETEVGDVPFYPKRLAQDIQLMSNLVRRANNTRKVSFLGRLGTYRYLNMDQVIGEALDFSREVVDALRHRKQVPVFPITCR